MGSTHNFVKKLDHSRLVEYSLQALLPSSKGVRRRLPAILEVHPGAVVGTGRFYVRVRPHSDWWEYRRSGSALPNRLLCEGIISTMTLKNAAFFALIGMTLLTVLLALGFIRDVSSLLGGAIAAIAVLISLIHLLASLSVAVFLYVFYKAHS